jgi:hypothetical protein
VADRYCRNCGQELPEDSRFCPNCGTPIQEAAHVPTPEADVPIPPPIQQQQVGGSAPQPQQQAAAPQEDWRQRHPILTGCLAIIVLLILGGVLAPVFSGGGGEGDAAGDGNQAQQEQKAQPTQEQQQPQQNRADYDGPAKPGVGSTDVVLRVSGSEGGAYKGWVFTDRNITWDDALYHTDKPDFTGVIQSEPTEYRLKLENGSYKDPTGDWVWNAINVDLKKATRQGRDWEGELYAELIVDGKEVSCGGSPPFEGVGRSWSPEKSEGGFTDTLNCE